MTSCKNVPPKAIQPTPSAQILELLTGEDRRSLGRSDQAVKLVLGKPRLLPILASFLGNQNPVVAARAADALEKIQRELATDFFDPLRHRLLSLAREAKQHELRWHLAQMIPRLRLSKSQRLQAAETLESYFRDSSAIVRVSALQAIVELASQEETLQARARYRLEEAMKGSAAERARAGKLYTQYFGLAVD